MKFKVFKNPLVAAICGLLVAGSVTAQDGQQAATTSELLELVREARLTQSAELEARLAEVRADQANQQRELDAERAERGAQEQRSTDLENTFNANELTIAEKQDQLDERLGALRELFGHLTGAAGDAR